MALADMLPTFDDAALLSLRANAVRLSAEAGAKHDAASALLPLIDAEIAERDAKKPPKVVRKAPRKAAAKAVAVAPVA